MATHSPWLPLTWAVLVGVGTGCGRAGLSLRAAPPDAGGDTSVERDLANPPEAHFADTGADQVPDTRNPNCGNGWLDKGEECDDSNILPDDGCNSNCRIECYWETCGPRIGLPTVICGDGRRSGGEECDDSNTAADDGCSAVCTVEPGYRCNVPGRACTPICGDRRALAGETCDDGNTTSGDGCSDICLVEAGWDCPGDVCRRNSSADGGWGGLSPGYCGDGILQGAEECDDGPANGDSNYGGCGVHCLYVFCGDSVVNGDEDCDLGVLRNKATYGDPSGCTRDCKRPAYCGDGTVDWAYGEQCDTPGSFGLPCVGCSYVAY